MVKAGSVTHPSLPSHPSHENAKKYFRKNCYGSVFCFEVKGENADEERANGRKFIDNIKMSAHLANGPFGPMGPIGTYGDLGTHGD